MIQAQTLFDDGDQHVRGDRSPYLHPDRVFGCSKEGLDAQMLFDPFEEQLDLPAMFVKCANSQRRKCHVVRQKLQCLAGFRIDIGHLPNQLWMSFVRLVPQCAKRRPRKQAQAQINGGRIQCVNGCAQQRFEIGARCVVGGKRGNLLT